MLSRELLLARLDECIAVEASPASGRLPPERELASRLGVSRAELRKALGQLEAAPGPDADYHSYAEHEAVVAAIARRDPEGAAAAMREHLETTRRLLSRRRGT
jgi:DNA-binding FadR family transcriptional regulator